MKRVLLSGLAGLSFLGSCSSHERQVKRPDVVILISIDTLRADHLGVYGYERPTSPRMDALGERAVVFEDVTSPSPWTLPAHGSLLTGLYPNRHGLKSHERYLPSHVPTLASVLSKQGWLTAAVVNSHNLGPNFGLDRGFQLYEYVEETADQSEPSAAITDQAVTWLRDRRSQSLFLFIHYYDVHTDYRSLSHYEQGFVAPYSGRADGTTMQLLQFREGEISLGEADAAHLVDLYDAGIRQMDDELGRLFDFLHEADLWDQSLLILTSDHGEEFLEHGDVLHGRSQFQEVLRVPLVFVGPGVPGPRRVPTPVSLVDIVPTVLSLTGVEIPEGLDGVDLTLLWSGAPKELEKRFIFGEADHNNVEHDITRSIRHGFLKLHFNRLTRQIQLYDLGHDPKERTDIAAERQVEATRLLGELEKFLEAGDEVAPSRVLSPEEIDKLRSLGYIR